MNQPDQSSPDTSVLGRAFIQGGIAQNDSEWDQQLPHSDDGRSRPLRAIASQRLQLLHSIWNRTSLLLEQTLGMGFLHPTCCCLVNSEAAG
jgi:hypothetical protein